MIMINPGTGPVDAALCRHAWKAARVMRRDLFDADLRRDPEETLITGVQIARHPARDERGRYGFRFTRGKLTCDVEIPGLPIERVRYLGRPHQNVWHFPRLYVDGNSWLWVFAISFIRSALYKRSK